MDKDEADKIREAAENGRIRMVTSEGVDSFDPQFVNQFLERVCGVSSAWISDMSSLSDFGKRNEDTYAKIQDLYGVDVRGKNDLLDIFRIIYMTPKSVH